LTHRRWVREKEVFHDQEGRPISRKGGDFSTKRGTLGQRAKRKKESIGAPTRKKKKRRPGLQKGSGDPKVKT